MQKWNGTLLRKYDDVVDGNASVGTTVVVRNTISGTLAIVYDIDDVNSVQKNNPFVTDDFGRYSFYAPNGKYTIEFGDGSDSIDIVLVDNFDLSSYRRSTTVAEIATGVFQVNTTLEVTDRGGAFFKVVSGVTPDGFGRLGAGSGKVAIPLIQNGEFNVVTFGAVGDDVTDDYPAIQATNEAAVDYANLNEGAIILYPPFSYFIKGTIAVLPSGESTLTRYNTGQAGTLTSKVENITIRGYGARVRCNTSTFVPSFPFCMMTSIEADNVKCYGLAFESDLNNKVPNWFDSSNYYNRVQPTVTGESAFIAIRTTGFKFIDCPVHHCEVGLVIADDRTFTITNPDPMNTYRSEVRGCDFYNCWQLVSMTYGSAEELIIHANTFRYGFIKLVQETDQGRALHFKNNTLRDISAFIVNTNDTQITGNTFNNFLGGFALQPQGGSNPSTAYNYDLVNMLIKDNTCYSDHMTEINGEAIGFGTGKPQSFIRIAATAAATANQTVNIDNLRVEGNTAILWGVGGSSTGSFINRDGDAIINIKSMSVTGKNKITIMSGGTATICLSPDVPTLKTSISGTLDISGNEFLRENVAASIREFQMWFATSSVGALVKFNDNIIRMAGSSFELVTVRNVQRFESKGNNCIVSPTAIGVACLYHVLGVRGYEISGNTAKRNGGGNIGYIVYHDGFTSGVYDTQLDKGKYVIKNNIIDNAQFVLNSPLAFPSTSKSFFDLSDNTITSNTIKTFQTYPSISGFTAFNAVNPHNASGQPAPDVQGVPPYFVIWNTSIVSGTPTGWRYTGAWTVLSLNP